MFVVTTREEERERKRDCLGVWYLPGTEVPGKRVMVLLAFSHSQIFVSLYLISALHPPLVGMHNVFMSVAQSPGRVPPTLPLSLSLSCRHLLWSPLSVCNRDQRTQRDQSQKSQVDNLLATMKMFWRDRARWVSIEFPGLRHFTPIARDRGLWSGKDWEK